MPKVTILVWHTPTGRIVAVGEPVSQFEITFIGEGNQSVLVTEVDEALVKDLHLTHVVDMEKRILFR